MAEYAGYVATKPVDFGAISSDFLSKKIAVGQMKQAQELAQYKLQQKELEARQKLQRDEDKEFKSDLTSLKTPIAVPDQTQNTLNYNGLNNSREFLSTLNEKVKRGEITRSEYNRVYSNLRSQWEQVSEVTKSYSENFQKLVDTLPQQSPLGAWKIGKLGNAAQAGNKELAPIEDGTLVQYTIDPETGKRVKGDTLTNLGLLKDGALWSDIQKKSYPELFSDAEKAIGEYTVENGAITTTDKTKNPKFQTYLSNLVNGIIPDETAKARLLSSVGGYTFYSNEQERQQNVTMKLQNLNLTGEELAKAKKEAEENQIQMVLNSKGTYDVNLTPGQSAEAEAITRENILSRIDFKQTRDEPVQTKVIISPDKKIDAPKVEGNNTLKSSRRTWKAITSGTPAERQQAIDDLVGLYASLDYDVKPEIVYNPDKTVKSIKLWETDSEGNATKAITRFNSPRDIFKAFTPKDKKGSEIVGYDAAIKNEYLFD